MRFKTSITLSLMILLALAGVGVAQDSNFSTGPQYLMNYGSPMFMQSIATPSLSLSAPMPSLGIPAADLGVSSGTSSSTVTLPGPANLSNIYWGAPAKDEAVNSEVNSPVSEIEITGSEVPSNLPASIFSAGVEETVDAQALRQRGYGVTIGEAASFWKSRKSHAPRVYTNRDIERVHGS
jgi:hypothetical protein